MHYDAPDEASFGWVVSDMTKRAQMKQRFEIRATLAMVQASLGRSKEAREWLDLARQASKEAEAGGSIRRTLLDEAEQKILDLDFPRNPFHP